MIKIEYNTNLGNFNKYHFDKLSDAQLIEYAKLLIHDASKKEKAMNENDTYNNSYMFASATTNVSHIMNELNERGLVKSNFKFGVVGLVMYDANNIKELLELFRS